MSTAKNDKISCVQKISLTSASWAVKLFSEPKNVRQYAVASFIKICVTNKILNYYFWLGFFFLDLAKKSQNPSWPAGTELAGYVCRPLPSRPDARANRRRACRWRLTALPAGGNVAKAAQAGEMVKLLFLDFYVPNPPRGRCDHQMPYKTTQIDVPSRNSPSELTPHGHIPTAPRSAPPES